MPLSTHPAFAPGNVAVVTGAAGGIGLAAAQRFAGLGLRVALVDRDAAALEAAAATLPGSLAIATDVSDLAAMQELQGRVLAELGPVSVLMNNAGREGSGGPLAEAERWQAIFATNLFGALHGHRLFVPAMAASGKPGLVVNTGSKQGITTPPGNTAYNASKAALKVLTEALAHELRNTPGAQVTAHLLIPGFTFTGLTRARGIAERPAGAWTPEQVVDFMLPALAAGDFYILCPDNETPRALDEKRIAWSAGDILHNRPALSRWHEEWKERFAATIRP